MIHPQPKTLIHPQPNVHRSEFLEESPRWQLFGEVAILFVDDCDIIAAQMLSRSHLQEGAPLASSSLSDGPNRRGVFHSPTSTRSVELIRNHAL
jgi:hypothetical protein